MSKLNFWKKGDEKRLSNNDCHKYNGELFKLSEKMNSKGFYATEFVGSLNENIKEWQNRDIYVKLVKKVMRKYSKKELANFFWNRINSLKRKGSKFGNK